MYASIIVIFTLKDHPCQSTTLTKVQLFFLYDCFIFVFFVFNIFMQFILFLAVRILMSTPSVPIVLR